MKIKNRYTAIQGWMVEELGLTGNKLLAYAIIYGFSQDGESKFYGGIPYLKKWLGLTHDRDAIRVLNELVDAGLVKKEARSGKTSLYYVPTNDSANNTDQCQNGTSPNQDPCQNGRGTPAKMAEVQKSLTDKTPAKMADDNIYNKLNNKGDSVMVSSVDNAQNSQPQVSPLEGSQAKEPTAQQATENPQRGSGLNAHSAGSSLRWPVARKVIKDSFYAHTGKRPMMPSDLEERYDEVCQSIDQPLTLKVLKATLSTYFDTKWIDSPSVRGFLSPKVWGYVGTEEYVVKAE